MPITVNSLAEMKEAQLAIKAFKNTLVVKLSSGEAGFDAEGQFYIRTIDGRHISISKAEATKIKTFLNTYLV